MLPRWIKTLIKGYLQKRGYLLLYKNELKRVGPVYAGLEDEFVELYNRCAPFTMTSLERMYGQYQAIKYAANFGIPGDIVECGAWKGGSSMLAALTLLRLKDTSRRIFLFDTFEGMPAPDPRRDLDPSGFPGQSGWYPAGLDEAKKNLESTAYPKDKLIFVQGKVEETIPAQAPEQIALLRLDTDWYASTYHELLHLFPKLSHCGILIVDDYGHWKGAREATDRYFKELGSPCFLNRLDYTGRLLIKTH